MDVIEQEVMVRDNCPYCGSEDLLIPDDLQKHGVPIAPDGMILKCSVCGKYIEI